MGINCKGTVSASGSELLGCSLCVTEGFWGFKRGFVVLKVGACDVVVHNLLFMCIKKPWTENEWLRIL